MPTLMKYERSRKRLGCDDCKQKNVPTYYFVHPVSDTHELWICEACLKRLLTWEKP
jgi:hypothetical protein